MKHLKKAFCLLLAAVMLLAPGSGMQRRPAACTALTSVVWSGEAMAVSTTSFCSTAGAGR